MLMVDWFMATTILLPALAGFVLFFVGQPAIRRLTVLALSVILIIASLLVLQNGPFTYSPRPLAGVAWNQLLVAGDAVLVALFFYFGWRARSGLIVGLVALQAALVAYLEFALAGVAADNAPLFYVDHLSIVMALVIGIVGSAIAVYALHYMDHHEQHLRVEPSRQPKFFFSVLLFLGAMNGLVFANSLPWLFFFWEVTTLCSFLLIGHDGTEEAQRNALRALWMNLVGGVAFAAGMILLETTAHTLAVAEIAAERQAGGALLGLAFLVVAGCTKAAQLPFQSWLLGAMVAPTPVSALLHSSTMVKAGVYLIIRLAPGFEGTLLSPLVATAGAYTFVTAAALAVSQSNAKRVLAYSTISNLGLIIACAGLNSALAISAAVLLIVFHAVSKGLLFLGVGAIEQYIGSRDIEAMEGLLRRVPLLTAVTMIGILTMLLPPFGVLVAKWAALEAAARVPLAMLLLVAGSALTVVFWTKWMGRMMSAAPSSQRLYIESLSPLFSIPLVGLAALAILLTAALGWVMSGLIGPAVSDWYPTVGLASGDNGLVSSVGAFPVWALLTVLAVLVVVALVASPVREKSVRAVYACGENLAESGDTDFRSIGDGTQAMSLGSYYYAGVLGESKINRWANPIAIALLVSLMGVAIL